MMISQASKVSIEQGRSMDNQRSNEESIPLSRTMEEDARGCSKWVDANIAFILGNKLGRVAKRGTVRDFVF